MYFDLILISAILVTVYLGPFIVRRHPPGFRTYGWLLIGDGVAAGIALYLRNTAAGKSTGDLVGFVAVAAAVCLIAVPPVLRNLARRALMADYLKLARRLIDLRELLQPHMGAHRERELVDAVIAVRSGQVDSAVAVLLETRDALADEVAQRAIDERIVFTYLSARRWRDAIATYEATFLADDSAEREDEPNQAIGAIDVASEGDEGDDGDDGDEARATPAAATASDSRSQPAPAPGQRGAHSLSPQLLVEMVRAYCEVRDLESAARLVERIESSSMAREPVLAFLLHRARLVFLAFVGRTHAVELILAPSGPLASLPPASQCFWSGIARLNAGDRPGARTALEKAARLARRDRRARDVAESVIASIDEPGIAGPHSVAPDVAKLADRLTSAAADYKPAPKSAVPQLSGVPWRQIPVTAGLLCSNLIAFAWVMIAYGSTGDMGGLVRAGANVQSAVLAGEWWRLATSMFLHVGFVHLLFNAYVLWALGRLVEQMYGASRYFAVYMAAGLAGAVASAVSGAGVSVGASGAVLGLMGALIAELGLYRKVYPERWRKHMFRLLVFVAVTQVAIGFFYAQIDQAAHVGGLVAGALAAALLSPRSWSAGSLFMRGLAGFLALAGALAIAHGVWGVATTDYSDTLARYGQIEHRLPGGLAFTGPANLRSEEGWLVADAAIHMTILSKTLDTGENTELGQLITQTSNEVKLLKSDVRPRPEHRYMALPDPWQSREFELTITDIGPETRVRAVVFARWADAKSAGKEAWIGVIYVPEALADDIQPSLSTMLSSVHRQ